MKEYEYECVYCHAVSNQSLWGMSDELNKAMTGVCPRCGDKQLIIFCGFSNMEYGE